DVIRKQLAGKTPTEPATIGFEQGIYSSEWSERTYAECLKQAESLLFEGKRVLVDANFREERRRLAFLNTARQWGVPALFVECRAGEDVMRERLRNRQGDASDADWCIHEQVAARWEPVGPDTARVHRVVSTSGPIEMF